MESSRYYPIIFLFVITVLSYSAVNIFYKILEIRFMAIRIEDVSHSKNNVSHSFQKLPLHAYQVISERNLFGTADTDIEEQVSVEQLEPTQLKLALLGTVFGDGKFDYAVIEEVDKKKQGLFRVGDSVATASIVRILRGKVVLRVGGRDEILTMKESVGSLAGGKATLAALPQNVVTVSKNEIDNALKDMTKILTQARIRPYFSAGKADGFIISRIKPQSIFFNMGLQNGDVIQGVNGSPVGNPDDLIGLYNGLKTGSEISIDIKRRGKQESIKYVFQ